MLTFTLAISCLTTYNLPWFMDLTFQVPMQYCSLHTKGTFHAKMGSIKDRNGMDLTFQVPMQYYSLQHQTLHLSPIISTTGCCFCFGSMPSFFLELFLHWSPVAYWAPTDPGSSSFSVLSFCLFIQLMGFSWQEYWSGLPFPSPVDHILSELSTMTRPPLAALHGMA